MKWIAFMALVYVIYLNSFEPLCGFYVIFSSINFHWERNSLCICISSFFFVTKWINSGSLPYRPAVHSKLNSIHDHRIYLMTMNVGPRGNPLSIQLSICAWVRQPYIAYPCHCICGKNSLAHTSICTLSILSLYRFCHPHSFVTLPFFSLRHACTRCLSSAVCMLCVHTCHLFLISFSFNFSFVPFLSQLKQQNTVFRAKCVSFKRIHQQQIHNFSDEIESMALFLISTTFSSSTTYFTRHIFYSTFM